MGDWTDDARKLFAFPQDAYPDNTGPHDYTRAVLDANPSPPKRRRERPLCGRSAVTFASLVAVLVLGLGLVPDASAETWRGLVVAPEHRCSPYDKKRDYPYPQSVERDIVRELGAVYGPYTGTCFASTRQTDIEHIVAASEAHDSGLCAADPATKARFSRDLRNLTLESPQVNRYEKSGRGCRRVGPGPESVLVRGTGHRSAQGLRAHRGPAGGAGARGHPLIVRDHGA